MSDTCLIYVNLYGYDPVVKIPNNMPINVTAIYITDSMIYFNTAKQFGWKVYYLDDYINITDNFQRRKTIVHIRCYPEKICPDILNYTYVFMCDSNVVNLDSNYPDFINKKDETKCLYLTSGYYRGSENTMQQELNRSLQNSRWSYNYDQMTNAVNDYHKQLESLNINLNDTPVVSAKYIGWNIAHPYKNVIADVVYKEHMKHIQGNIIFSLLLKLYPEYIYNYTDFKNDGSVSRHNHNY